MGEKAPIRTERPIISNEPRNEALRNSCDERKKLLSDLLEKGVDIGDEFAYNALVKLLHFNKVADFRNIPFQSMNAGLNKELKITIKKMNKTDDFYSVFTFLSQSGPKKMWRQVGMIKEGKYETIQQSKLGKEGFYESEVNVDLYSLVEKYGCSTCEAPQAVSKPPETIIDEPPLEYRVQKGEGLWKIVKEKYGLTGGTDIANVMNKVVAYNKTKKQRVNKEQLFKDQLLYLPKSVTFRESKFSLVDEPKNPSATIDSEKK